MYALEYKQLYIPREALTKNRCFQGYRWKQYAVCEERKPLEQIKATKKRPAENTRIFEQGMAAALSALDNENRR